MSEMVAEVPRWALELVFVAYAVVVAGFVILERRRPAATLAWILALVFVPIVGLLFYALIGRRRVRRRARARARRTADAQEGTRDVASLDQIPAELPVQQRGLVRLAMRTSAAPVRRADDVRILGSPSISYGALLEALAAAERNIHLEFYIWRDDPTARGITEALTARARQGVGVRVLYDAFGSLGLPDDHFAALRAAGGEVAAFGPLRLPTWFRHRNHNFRNHRKLVVVDGRVGLLGGMNVGAEYLRDGQSGGFRDLMVRVEGDATLGLDAIFRDDWFSSTGRLVDVEARDLGEIRRTHKHRRLRDRGPRPDNPLAGPPIQARSRGPILQIIPSGPDLPVISAIASQFSAAIAGAQRRCFIATPYFVPDEPLLLTLRTAAMRGVDLRILLPTLGHSDSRIAALAARSYYDDLTECGCRIYEYRRSMLHAKYLVVDDHVCAIGSANMDVRSFYLNYEVTAMFYDATVTHELAALFEGDLAEADEVEPQRRGALAFHARLLEAGARVLSPLL